MAKHAANKEDRDLLDELGVDVVPAPSGGRTPKEQRIIAGFEEIERFVEEHGRLPQHGENLDIFERLYAVRLDRLRESEECRAVLAGIDARGLLGAAGESSNLGNEEVGDEELLASLGIESAVESDVTRLTHVRSRDEINAAEEIARRIPCLDFAEFKPLFEAIQRELEAGKRKTLPFRDNPAINKDNVFILEGQKLIIAESGDEFITDYGRRNRRLRVIFDNGTESAALVRSLQRALYDDPSSRRITDVDFLPLFSDAEEEDDQESGFIYVLRSKSDHPFVAEHRAVIHKIGVTGGNVKSRISGAKKDPTYLLAEVELIATFKLANINRKILEALLHNFFASARLDMELKDRFGSQVEPREWFLVPFPLIEEAIDRIKNETIANVRYDAATASIVPA
jgi:hypothetical protein